MAVAAAAAANQRCFLIVMGGVSTGMVAPAQLIPSRPALQSIPGVARFEKGALELETSALKP